MGALCCRRSRSFFARFAQTLTSSAAGIVTLPTSKRLSRCQRRNENSSKAENHLRIPRAKLRSQTENESDGLSILRQCSERNTINGCPRHFCAISLTQMIQEISFSVLPSLFFPLQSPVIRSLRAAAACACVRALHSLVPSLSSALGERARDRDRGRHRGSLTLRLAAMT